MKEKNKRIVVIVSILLFGIVSFSYVLNNNLNSNNKVYTASINNTDIKIEGNIDFNKSISKIKVTATGNNELVGYNLIWNGNIDNNKINYKIYKSGIEIKEKNIKDLEEITSGVLDRNTKALIKNEFITGMTKGQSIYYYIIIDKTIDIKGDLKIEESDSKPKIDILAAFIQNDDGEYVASSETPKSGYALNKEKSTCSNGTIPTWNVFTNKLILNNLTKNGTSCNLYFDKINGSDKILVDAEIKEGVSLFSKIATDADTGLFSGEDDDGITYYYRGNVTNNYLKFANKWWRIIRINGDRTIRIIYDGASYHANGTSTTDSIAVTNQTFSKNGANNDNAYVGFMYGATGASTYEATHANTNKSNVLEQLETWYNSNLASYEDRIDKNAGFCGDRSIASENETWWNNDTKKGYGTNNTAYGAFLRLVTTSNNWATTQTPTFNCPNTNDLYTMSESTKGNKVLDKPIGMITVDEIIYAGGFGGKSNSTYYLRNGNAYWTMTPYYFNSVTKMYATESGGGFNEYETKSSYGIRPVINLRSDVQIAGSGTETDPFVVN